MVYKWSGCKFTADRYAVYKWLGCKFSPSPKGEGLFPYFYRKDGKMKKTGFYIIKDKFFEDMTDPYLKGNKEETDLIIIALKIQIQEFIG